MYDWFQDFWDWLSEQFQTAFDFLDIMKQLLRAAEWLAGMLPPANPAIASILSNLDIAANYFLTFISYCDFFINVPFLARCIGVMIVTETLLLVLRGWRVARSLLT